jgi:beta-galactosidase
MSTPRIPHPRRNPKIWHGGDWNPDQWLDQPEVIDEDFRLFKEAGANVVSIGIFAWTRLEPEDGRYEFGWLDSIMDRLAAAGMQADLATPSGAKPAWMAQKYPEILRVQANRVRDLQGGRHNHCYSSPVFRRKAVEMNTRLAERYKDHPALALWHVSNEYGGECHCPLCQDAFRTWLKARYGSLDALNAAWWTDFWSHRYTDWSQLESPAPQGETSVHGLNLDWKRFVDHQSLDFFKAESAPLRRITPDVPVTVNMMGTYPVLNYWNWAQEVDIVSWDCYPRWHNPHLSELEEASRTAFLHDINRSLKGGQPWLLMESTPSQVNWQPVNRLKAPGMHRLASLQAVAHGSDSVMYFQWRKGRGAAEKFHGAVVDHSGSDNRTFREVAELGRELAGLGDVAGSRVPARAAVVYDWENRWAIDDFQGFSRLERDYEKVCMEFHRGLWQRSIPCDVPNQDQDLGGYQLVAAPMLHLLKPGTAERLDSFVRAGGILLITFLTGYVGESDLCFREGFPGPLRPMAGIKAEELDALWPEQKNRLVPVAGNPLGLAGEWQIDSLCEIVVPEGAEVLATYGDDWYAGKPVLTRHRHGQGWVYHLAAKVESAGAAALMGALAKEAGVEPVWPEALPAGVQAECRSDGATDFVFLMNWNREAAGGLPGYGCQVVRRPAAT